MQKILPADGPQFALCEKPRQRNVTQSLCNCACIVIRLVEQASPTAIASEQQAANR